MQIPTIVIGLDPHLSTASAVIAIRVGSKDEFPGTFGLAHVLEHMIFRGTLKHPSQLDFVRPFVELGAKFNGETGRDRTMYHVTSLPSNLLPALSLLMEMIKQPLFDQAKFPIEKEAVLNELKTHISESSYFLQNELLVPNVFRDDYPRYHPPIGMANDVKTATFQSLMELYRSAYTDPSRIVISLYGNLLDPKTTVDQLKSKVEQMWESIPYSVKPITPPEILGRSQSLGNSLQEFVKRDPGPRYPLVRKHQLTEAYVAIGWVSTPVDTFENYVLTWISAYLTGELISALYLELRVKRGLVYQIVSGQYGLETTGMFYITWQTGKRENIPLTIELIFQVLDQLKNFHDQRLLNMWKHWMVTRYQMQRDQSVSTAKLYAQQMLLKGEIRSLKEIVKLIQGFTCQDIRSVATKVFTKQVTIAVVAP